MGLGSCFQRRRRHGLDRPVYLVRRGPHPRELPGQSDVLGAVQQGNVPLPGPTGRARVGQNHEFADRELGLGLLGLGRQGDDSLAVFPGGQHYLRLLPVDDDRAGFDAPLAKLFRQLVRQGEPRGRVRVDEFLLPAENPLHQRIAEVGRDQRPGEGRLAGDELSAGVQLEAQDQRRPRLASQQTEGVQTQGLGHHVAGALGQINRRGPLGHGLVQGRIEFPGECRVGDGQPQTVASFRPEGRVPWLDVQGVVHVPGGLGVDGDIGEAVGGLVGGLESVELDLHVFGVVGGPAVALGVASPREQVIMM